MRKKISSRLIIGLVIAGIFGISISVYTGQGKVFISTNIVGTVLAPIQKGLTNIANMFARGYDYFFEFDSLREENIKLKRELREAEAEIRDINFAKQENEHLKDLLAIKQQRPELEFEICEIIARSSANWSSTLTIDKGTNVGLKKGDIVMTEDGMLGYISEAGYNFSEITTILDTDMSAGAIATRTREVVVAKGDFELMGDGMLKLSYIQTGSELVIGDTIETSGTGGIFPKGILIGTVEKILPEEHGISNYAVIKPSASIDKAKTAFVVKNYEVSE